MFEGSAMMTVDGRLFITSIYHDKDIDGFLEYVRSEFDLISRVYFCTTFSDVFNRKRHEQIQSRLRQLTANILSNDAISVVITDLHSADCLILLDMSELNKRSDEFHVKLSSIFKESCESPFGLLTFDCFQPGLYLDRSQSGINVYIPERSLTVSTNEDRSASIIIVSAKTLLQWSVRFSEWWVQASSRVQLSDGSTWFAPRSEDGTAL